MSAPTAVGFGTLRPTSPKANQKLVRLPFVLPTVKVSSLHIPYVRRQLTSPLDANLFKEAFIKAQQENEALFKADAGEEGDASAAAVEAAPKLE